LDRYSATEWKAEQIIVFLFMTLFPVFTHS
jgi:hypothetical protein